MDGGYAQGNEANRNCTHQIQEAASTDHAQGNAPKELAVAMAAPAVLLDSAPSLTEPLVASVAAPAAALAAAQAESRGLANVDDLS